MILPLGLGYRYIRFPYVTLVLCLVSAGVYFYYPSRASTISKTVSKNFQSLEIGLLEKKLFSEYCSAQGGSTKICGEIGGLIEEGYQDNSKENESSKTELLSKESIESQIYYLSIFRNFKAEIKKPTADIEQLAGFQPFSNKYEALKSDVEKYYRSENILSCQTMTPLTILFSQFCHASIFHLLGNLIFLIIFGAYVEQRLSAVAYLGIYLVAGSLGLLGHVYLQQEPIRYLVGASANVSAVMGMFFIFFFRSQMKFLIWFVAGKTFYAPVSVAFPLIYVVQELLLGLDKGDGIAHFAHLGGFFIGAWAAFLFDSFKPVKAPLLYPQEKLDMAEIKNEPDFYKKIALTEKMLKYNPKNFLIRDKVILEIFEKTTNLRLVDARIMEFLKKQGPALIADKLLTKHVGGILAILEKCPLGIPLESFLNQCNDQEILKIGDSALLNVKPVLAMRVYDYFIVKFPNSSTLQNLTVTIKEALKIIMDDQAVYLELKTYFMVARSTAIIAFISELADDDAPLVIGGSNGSTNAG